MAIYFHRYDGGGSYFHGKDGFNDVEFENRPDVAARVEEENGIDAIRRIVRDNPGKEQASLPHDGCIGRGSLPDYDLKTQPMAAKQTTMAAVQHKESVNQ